MATEAKILQLREGDSLSLLELGVQEQEWWDALDPVSQLRIGIGMAWEEWYLPQLSHVSYHPGELHVEGVYMTHDGESLETVVSERGEEGLVLAVHEVKATYKSTKTVGDFETQWMWRAQVMAYCYALKATVAYMHILFLCGDYTWPQRPILKVARIEFTPEEIEKNWQDLHTYAEMNT